jgi:peptidyl-prolyl cis-trans isomerase B (cyclophilin B)
VLRAAVLLTLAAALVGAASGCGGDSGSTADSTSGAKSSGGCATVDAPAPREDGSLTAPTDRLDPDLTWTLTFRTSCGTFVVTLDVASAPATTASLVALARDGFYDDTVFHRIVPGFVIQGGDPTQTGGGGPGYSTVDPPAADAAYVKGVVAMAKTGAEPAGTAGSQFFVVTADDAGLPPDYAIVGNVTQGLDVVERIGTMGDAATEQPLQPVVVESVTAASSP